jgi:hypothetical protein
VTAVIDTSPSRGKVCEVFEGETLGVDLLGVSDVKPQKAKEFCNDKPQNIQSKPFRSEDFGCIFVPSFVKGFHRFNVYFTGRVK